MSRLYWEAAPGACLHADMIPADQGIDEIQIIAQRGQNIQITGCDGAELERDGRALASAKSKSLSATGKPIVIRKPGKDLRVWVE